MEKLNKLIFIINDDPKYKGKPRRVARIVKFKMQKARTKELSGLISELVRAMNEVKV